MRPILRVFAFILLLWALFLPANVFAHALWIEKQADGKTAVFYGEYGDGLREKSGEKLDSIAHLEAWSIAPAGEKTLLKADKAEDRFLLNTKGGAVLVQEAGMPVKDMTKYKIGVAKSYLYARSGTTQASKPELRLDSIPSTDLSKARVYFDGNPLAEEKAIWTAPNGWMKELKTDAEGWVSLEQPWPGLYVLEVTHTMDKPGKFEDKDYAVERHRASLSIEKA